MHDWWQTTFPRGQQQLEILDANQQSVTIAYGEVGTGQPIVLAHGIASWSYAWRHVIPLLAPSGRVICFDAKGSGFSDKPRLPEKSNHRVVELVRVIQALCDRPAVVVAESLGALVALAVAETNPDLIDRLVVINVPIFAQCLPNWGMQLLADLPAEWVEFLDDWRVPKLASPLIRSLVYALRGEVIADPASVTWEEMYWTTYPQLELPGTVIKLAEEFRVAAREIDQAERGTGGLLQNVREQLDHIRCPVLILWSDSDRWFPVEHGERLRDRIPKACLTVIPNCGHYAAGGQPAFVASQILNFLETSASV
jgi:haloalkane dehalogenase